jgi:hypothetical protein
VPEEAGEPCPYCDAAVTRRVASFHVVSCTHTKRLTKLHTHNTVAHAVAAVLRYAGLSRHVRRGL